MKKPLIIAVSAVSGGGKTTVIKELNKQLPLSKAIYFDDYDFKECPQDFFEWVQRGSDYNEWNLRPLVNDIKPLLEQSNVNYILLDYPFAYKNNQVAPYIDYSIFIDTPLDVAIARRILRDLIKEPSESLRNDLNCYLSRGRIAYLEMLNSIKPNSDLIIDGALSIDKIVCNILNYIPKL